MSLALYNKKRNFKKTLEPKGQKAKPEEKLSFVVQRHKASHLHYDFRLEMNGVLKSWAVPKGPSMNPGDKRLAMMVEDHPYTYKDFEGIIPAGNYGAGIVEIWDKGYYTDIDSGKQKNTEKELLKELEAGNLKFVLYGKKLKGEFALVKMKGADKNAWLLIKHKDEYAAQGNYSSEDFTPQTSPINKWKKQSKQPKKAIKPLPEKPNALVENEGIKPMLAKEMEEPFDDKKWIFEIKWDGYRALADIKGKDVFLYSRNGNSFNATYPIIVQELSKLKLNALLDGEIVVLNSKGLPSFQFLQDYKTNSSHPINYNVFDMLSMNGKSICDIALLERKKLLKKILPANDVVKYVDHIETQGKALFEEITKRNMEGIMAKKVSSLYHPGVRTKDWLKIKKHKTQDAIIVGFTRARGERKHFGALILAVKEGNSFIYIGHTGTGFTTKTLKELSDLLNPLIQNTSPFDKHIKTNMPVTWVKTKLVCEVKYTERTNSGILRHPVFLHLRTDQTEKDVTMENRQASMPKTKLSDKDKSIYDFGEIKVQVTHSSKLYWPKEGITKGDLINYYQDIADAILPYLKNRPQSLKRNPNGILDHGFFHKDAGGEAPEWVETSKIYSDSANKEIDYILCNNKATLCYLNNLGCIELNPWHSTIKTLDRPDYLVIDIDPSEKNTFDQVIEVVLAIHEILEKVKAVNFCKTSGATGIHVYVPAQKKYTYDQLKSFSQLICIRTNEMLPEFTSLDRNLQKRGNKKIYLDYLQNRRGQTIAAPYSLRPVTGATVSMPLDWKEVKKGLSPLAFNMETARKRLQKKGDIFSGILGTGIDLLHCLKLLSKD